MLDSTRFVLFLTAALLLAIAPGPGMLYVLARSLAGVVYRISELVMCLVCRMGWRLVK